MMHAPPGGTSHTILHIIRSTHAATRPDALGAAVLEPSFGQSCWHAFGESCWHVFGDFDQSCWHGCMDWLSWYGYGDETSWNGCKDQISWHGFPEVDIPGRPCQLLTGICGRKADFVIKNKNCIKNLNYTEQTYIKFIVVIKPLTSLIKTF